MRPGVCSIKISAAAFNCFFNLPFYAASLQTQSSPLARGAFLYRSLQAARTRLLLLFWLRSYEGNSTAFVFTTIKMIFNIFVFILCYNTLEIKRTGTVRKNQEDA